VKILFATLLSLSCFMAYAASEEEKKIREYIHQIEETQKDIAGLLVMQNFSRIFVKQMEAGDASAQIDLIFSSNSQYGLSNISTQFFDLIYSDKIDQEKIDSVTRLLILMRSHKHAWVKVGRKVRSASESFLANFQSSQDICSEQNFLEALATVENFAPTGVDAKRFRKNWIVRMGGTYSESPNGEGQYSANASLESNGDEDQVIRHAVAGSAGVVASLWGGPLAGAAAGFVVEAVWGMFDMQRSMNEMARLAKYNNELYEIMNVEINVKKHFDSYCRELERAYIEVRPLVLNAKTPEGLGHLEKARGDFLAANPIDVDVDTTKFFRTPNEFYRFAKLKALTDAVNVFSDDAMYFESWNRAIDRIDEMNDRMEHALNQIIAHRRQETYNPDVSIFTNLIAQVETLNNLKSAFTKEMLAYFDLITDEDRDAAIVRMKNLVENYRIYHMKLNEDETAILESYESAIDRIGA